jgi:hypothetical protein
MGASGLRSSCPSIARNSSFARLAEAQKIESGHDGRERVAQFVSQHREKFVFRAARRHRGGASDGLGRVQLCALERLLAAPRDRGEKGAFVRVKPMTAVKHEHDHTSARAADRQRQGGERLDASRPLRAQDRLARVARILVRGIHPQGLTGREQAMRG